MTGRADLSPSDLYARATNLPVQLTTFVGREQEGEEVKRLLADARLVTLTGAGGIGKTRLALVVAAELLDDQPDGVWLVELTALADPSLVPQAVASALRVGEVPGQPFIATLTSALGPRQLLLVLDNCEHLAAACAELVDRLLRGCPRLRILATSREPLGVPGEFVWRVPSLSVPPAGVAIGTDEIASAESVGLFIERARSVLPSFVLEDRNAAAVAEICRRLDGIPLAIELAAARVNVLGPEQILRRLDDRFRLLIGHTRTSPSRQQTLRATLDWSYRLLTDRERTLFCRLAVFAAGCTLEAAEAVCVSGGVAADEVLELLGCLVDKSLLGADTQADEARYRLLDTLRQYGWEMLADGDRPDELRRRHAAYFVALAERAEPELQGPSQRTWSDRLEQEHDNLRAALGWCREHDGETGLRLAGRLERFWHIRGYLTEGRGWLSDLLVRAPGGTAAHARARYVIGELALRQGDYPAARSQLEESVALYRDVGDESGVVLSRERLGRLAALEGEYERGRALVEESLALFRATGDRWNVAWTLNDLVLLALAQGDYGRAGAFCEEALAVFRAIGDKQGIGYSLSNLGQVARLQGQFDRARALFDEALALFRELQDKPFIGRTLYNLGTLALLRGEAVRAGAILREALSVLHEVESRYLCLCLGLSGILKVRRGEYDRGVRLVGAAAGHANVRAAMHPDELLSLDAGLAAARAALGHDAFAEAWAEGEAMTLGRAVEHALEDGAATVSPRRTEDRSDPEPQVRRSGSALSAREREVALLIARGLTNREIADALVIAERTAESHVTHVLAKLGLRSRAQVVVWAVEHGW